MNRGRLTVTVMAAVVGLAVAAAIVVIATAGDDKPDRVRAQQTFTGERAPEPETQGAGELRAVQAAARRFLDGYLPLIYGQRSDPRELRAASAQLIGQLVADPGRVPPAQAELDPDLQQVTVISDGPLRALATAQIKDSPSSPAYPLTFQLEKSDRGWLVTRIGAD